MPKKSKKARRIIASDDEEEAVASTINMLASEDLVSAVVDLGENLSKKPKATKRKGGRPKGKKNNAKKGDPVPILSATPSTDATQVMELTNDRDVTDYHDSLNAGCGPMAVDRMPGDTVLPLTYYSGTITKTKGDVSLRFFDVLCNDFLKTKTVKAGCGTEVGNRAHRFHLQFIFKMHGSASKKHCDYIGKWIKKTLPQQGVGHRVYIKAFAKGQTESAMIGYILKVTYIYYIYMTHIIYKVLYIE